LLFSVPDCDAGQDDSRLFRKYDLCTEVVQDPTVINNMTISDALNITHALHDALKAVGFRATSNAIQPWCPNDDVLAACNLLDQGSAARSYCDILATDPVLPPTLSAAAASALVPALNQYYGIVVDFDGGVSSRSGPVAGALSGIWVASAFALARLWQ